MYDVIVVVGEVNFLFVVVVGNSSRNIDNSLSYLVSYDLENIIVVVVMDKNDNMFGFFNYGVIIVDLGVFGFGILSIVLGERYVFYSGIFMVFFYVVGVVVLVLVENFDLSYVEVKEIIFDNVDFILVFNGKILMGGWLNVDNVLFVMGSFFENFGIYIVELNFGEIIIDINFGN